jgi:hypothetical protein
MPGGYRQIPITERVPLYYRRPAGGFIGIFKGRFQKKNPIFTGKNQAEGLF